MVCGVILLVSVLAPSTAPAANAPPAAANAPAAPVPPAPSPATQPSPQELHAQAYQFMRAGQFDRATPLLNRAFNLTPPAQRDRALILNLALLELVQKQSVLHGIRELYAYMARHPKHDEAAMNILGSSLNVAVENPKWRDGPIYSAAYREFSRREVAMERLRPGFRRWGPRWITEEDWQEIKRKERELTRQMSELGEKMTRLDTDMKSATAQMAEARRRVSAFGWHSHGTDPTVPVYIGSCTTCQQLEGLADVVNELMQGIHAESLEMSDYRKRYDELKKELDKLKPDWPASYDPIDPSAPPPPEPANPPLPTTLPAGEQTGQ
jgi:hypothetical protein